MGGKHLAPPQEHSRRDILRRGGIIAGVGAVVVATGELPRIIEGKDEADSVTLAAQPELDPPTPSPIYDKVASDWDEIVHGDQRRAIATTRRELRAREQAESARKQRVARRARREAEAKRKAQLQAQRRTSAARPVAAGTAAAIIATSRKYFGIPYVWGGKTTAGLDCSGYTKLVYDQHGVNLPHGSRYQARRGVAVTDPQSGDLVFYYYVGGLVHHVGIYVGDGYMHDAPRRGLTVGRRRVRDSRVFYRRVI